MFEQPTLIFGICDTPNKLFDITKTKLEVAGIPCEIETSSASQEGSLRKGKYTLHTDSRLGGETKHVGEIYVDDLVSFVTYGDSPKPKRIVNIFSELPDVELICPTYSSTVSHEFYRAYGNSGHSLTLSKTLSDWSISRQQSIDPEEQMKIDCVNSSQIPSEELLEQKVDDLFEKGYYISHMNCSLDPEVIPQNNTVSFSAPMSIRVINPDMWNLDFIELCFIRMNELQTGMVSDFS